MSKHSKPKTCPCCNGEVAVSDCGYTSFNPASAKCLSCDRKWKLGYVDSTDGQTYAVKKWNKLRPYVIKIEKLETKLERVKRKAGVINGS